MQQWLSLTIVHLNKFNPAVELDELHRCDSVEQKALDVT